MATTTKEPPAAASKRVPVRQIKTLAPERPFVTIDDVEHELKLELEFGEIDHQRWTRDSRLYDTLFNSNEPLDDAEQIKMAEVLDGLLDLVLVNPSKLRRQTGKRLSGAIKREIVLAFTNAPFLMAAVTAQTDQQQTNAEESESSTSES